MEFNFVRKEKPTLTQEHIDDIKHAIKVGYATWGSIEALHHCKVITVSAETGEDIDELKNIFSNSFYTEVNEFKI
jgi:selenocysteine-specific translation elongation factor